MKEPLAAFKAARLFSLVKMREMNPSEVDVDSLMAFPFLSTSILALKDELPRSVAAAEDIDPSYDSVRILEASH